MLDDKSKDQARVIIADALGINVMQVDSSADIETLSEWNSLKHVSIVLTLEQVIGRQLEIEEILEATSVAGIETILLSLA